MDEVYRRCWGGFFNSDDPDVQRAQMYTNMIFSYWESMFELGAITEIHLRQAASIVLVGEEGHGSGRMPAASARGQPAPAADGDSTRSSTASIRSIYGSRLPLPNAKESARELEQRQTD